MGVHPNESNKDTHLVINGFLSARMVESGLLMKLHTRKGPVTQVVAHADVKQCELQTKTPIFFQLTEVARRITII